MISHARNGATPVWDREELLDKVGGIEELIGELIELFLRDAPGRIVAIGDGGIDERLYFGIHGQKDLASMAIEVKGGKNVSIAHLRALRGVLESDEAEIAGPITMNPLGDTQRRNFRVRGRSGDSGRSGDQLSQDADSYGSRDPGGQEVPHP